MHEHYVHVQLNTTQTMMATMHKHVIQYPIMSHIHVQLVHRLYTMIIVSDKVLS